MIPTISVRQLDGQDRAWLTALVEDHWGLPVVSVSGRHYPSELPGFVAEEHAERVGALTYRVGSDGVEVMTLNSLVESRGVGSALLEAARQEAARYNRRLWLITTNENMRAIGFYQRRGMDLVKLHRNFVDIVAAAKPNVEFDPIDGIAFKHALEFEYLPSSD